MRLFFTMTAPDLYNRATALDAQAATERNPEAAALLREQARYTWNQWNEAVEERERNEEWSANEYDRRGD